MQRSLLLRSELNSIVCAMIVVAAVLFSVREGKTHEVASDRQAVIYFKQRSTSGNLQTTHHKQMLKFAQGREGEELPWRGSKFVDGRGGGGGGGPAIGLGEVVALVQSVLPELAYGASLALLITLVAGGGRRLWDRIKKPSVFAAAKDVDVVECSVYGPRIARPGEEIMIAVFLHLGEQSNRAGFLAKATDLSATLRARCSEIAIRRGATVEISCAVNTLFVDEPVQSVVWQGRLASCQFLITLPERSGGRSFFAVVRVSVDGSLVGNVKFRISSDPDAMGKGESLGSLRRYGKPFVSYATRDRKEVLKRVQMLQILKTKFFMDLLSLDPGDRWEKKLYKHIDRCDLFLLFWSQAAKDSLWVLQEAEYALMRQHEDPDGEPDIVPVILEGNVLPPPSLAQLNFSDRLHYLISQMDRAEAAEG
jgi:hypothetical protein